MNRNTHPDRNTRPDRNPPRPSAHRVEWSRAMTLTDAEFLACWWELGLGDPPLELALELDRLPGSTPEQRRRTLNQTIMGIRRSGILDEHSGRRCALANALRLLSSPSWTLDLRISDRTSSLVALGALGAAQPEAAVMVRRDRHLSLLTTRAPRVPTTLVELVGPLTPGQARPVNIPVNIPADLLDQARRTAAGQSLWVLADHLIALGIPRNDANSLARVCTDITVAAQFGATGYEGGIEHRSPWVVGFHRTTTGDFLQLRRAEHPGGPETLTVVPITPDRLLTHVHGLIAAVQTAGVA